MSDVTSIRDHTHNIVRYCLSVASLLSILETQGLALSCDGHPFFRRSLLGAARFDTNSVGTVHPLGSMRTRAYMLTHLRVATVVAN